MVLIKSVNFLNCLIFLDLKSIFDISTYFGDLFILKILKFINFMTLYFIHQSLIYEGDLSSCENSNFHNQII